MMKILIGLLAALVVAVGGYFGFEFYVQQRIAADIEATFASVRASGAKAEHGPVSFDLWRRTVTIANISGELAAQPPVSLKIGRVLASGVGQPAEGRFAASRIELTNFEASGTIGTRAGLRTSYQAPRIEISDYSGPARPTRHLDSSNASDVYRFGLEHFATVTATSVSVPALTMKFGPNGAAASPGTGDYIYSGVSLRDIKDGKIASSTVDRATFTVAINAAGKTESLTGEIANLAAYDFDSSATLAMLDPARANDENYYRAYRQLTFGAYSASFQKGLKMRIDGATVDDIGLRPSKLQLPQVLAIIDAAPPPGTTPTPEQTRDLIAKTAGIYEGIRIGSAAVRGFAMHLPDGGPFGIAAARLDNLENGKIGELSVEGLEGKAPRGPVKLGRFALKGLDIAGLMRTSADLSSPGQKPSPEQLLTLLALVESAEMSNLVAPYKQTGKPVSIETLNISWGQFVGAIPTRARLTVKMNTPVDGSDPDPLKMLAAAGLNSASINFDLGAAWNESGRSFAVEPATLDIGNVLTAAVRLSLTNVQRETFSLNPLLAAIMAAQIEAGPVEIVLHDTGGVDLAISQQARQQNVSVEAARRAVIDSIRENAMKMASVNPDLMTLAGALTRFIEEPRGTLTIKLTPRGKVAMLQIVQALKGSPVAALARFQLEATAGR
jgi:hypothetical protein